MIAVGVALAVGILVFALLWSFGFLDNVQPRPAAERPQRPVAEQMAHADIAARGPLVGRMHVQSEADLRAQQQRCSAVRERCDPAARTIVAPERDDEALRGALGVLHAVVQENERDGPLGVIASTELCNALIAVNGLATLEKLQEDADLLVAKRSSAIFHHVIPRIWSF